MPEMYPQDSLHNQFSLSLLDSHIKNALGTAECCVEPFRHWVIDDFLPKSLAKALLDAFPCSEDPIWENYNYEMQKKSATNKLVYFPEPIRSFISYLTNNTFTSSLETLTSIYPLLSDPSLDGGGLHQIYNGGSLAVHADFARHKKYDITRRLNLIYYLNPGWRVSYRGNLCLYDSTGCLIKKEIRPIFNRLVIFETSNTSYHGHPEKLSVPGSLSRKSIALYYYTSKPYIHSSGINTRWRRPSMSKPRFQYIRKVTARLLWYFVCLSQTVQDCLKRVHDVVDPW